MTAHRHYERTEKGGRWAPSFSNEQFINTLGSINKLMSCRKVATEIGCSVPLAQKRLKDLHNSGKITGKKCGNTWVYWRMPEIPPSQ